MKHAAVGADHPCRTVGSDADVGAGAGKLIPRGPRPAEDGIGVVDDPRFAGGANVNADACAGKLIPGRARPFEDPSVCPDDVEGVVRAGSNVEGCAGQCCPHVMAPGLSWLGRDDGSCGRLVIRLIATALRRSGGSRGAVRSPVRIHQAGYRPATIRQQTEIRGPLPGAVRSGIIAAMATPPAGSLQFRMLGPLQVDRDGAPVRLGGQRQRTLLALLVVDANQLIATERLIDLLFGDAPSAGAVKALQVAVSRLRRALGGDPGATLQTQPGGYRLCVAPEQLDSAVFAQRLEEGRARLAGGDAVSAAAVLRDGLGLWRGAPLADLTAVEGVQDEIRRLEELRLLATMERIAADLALGGGRELIAELETLIATHPLQERLRGQLMLALYRAGQQTDALAVYREISGRLRDELGLQPGRALKELERSMLQHDPALDPTSPSGGPMRGPPEPLRKSRPVHRPTGGGEVRFCAAPDGARIAYAIHGSGAPLVRVGTWLTHLELDWESPVWRHWLDGLGASHTVLRYDERGCGLSDSELGELSVETWVGDLEAVVDAAGFERFVLLGVSQGAAIGVEYAARHPDRISDLVLYGGFARGRVARGQAKEQEALVASIRAGWSAEDPAFRRVFSALFLPEGTREQMAWFEELMRVTTTAEAAARLYAARGAVDVIETAPKVMSRTLVIHSRNDHMVPVEEGRLLARLIPNSGFVLLDSPNHILLEEPGWEQFLAELSRFLGTANRVTGSTAFAKLDAHELEVLELVASGLDDEAIAERVGIEVETVQGRLSSIYTKLGLTGKAARTAAAVWFTEARIASEAIGP